MRQFFYDADFMNAEGHLLKSHLDAVERQLLATSQIPANSGHTLHRGTPREAFIKQFLTGHLSAKLAVGTGEIIDANSTPRQQRNQFDIVVYNSEYPKIDFGGGISAFLAESVIAIIEVKSLLTAAEIDTATKSAARAKRLQRNLLSSFSMGWVPPGIISILVSYNGPAQISTVQSWLLAAEAAQGLNRALLPPTRDERSRIMCESIDAVICLGMGTIVFDVFPISFVTDEGRATYPQSKRMTTQSPEGNLLWLFLLLTQAASNVSAQWPNLAAYLQNTPMQGKFVP
ncbi:hypothetical protein QFZ27_000158 [Inquilinus ginsengisoli]|uniref:DUF6602 domain-containing protein n=1 Tax=Inquilinus ginsengisoli TaxID=363840 RepID=UPI003D1BC560